MAQTKFQYDYSNQRDAEKNAKRQCSHEWETVVVQHPVTRRYLVLMCDTDEDLPTRVPILWRLRLDPPMVFKAQDDDKWRALYELVHTGALVIVAADVGIPIQAEDLDQICSEYHNS